MSFGEAIAEASRQQAAQYLFDINGTEFETVETYAIIKLPFDILKANEQIPAALYLRQSHVGRFAGLNVPPNIYTDNFGGRQKTNHQTAVDFGGVILRDPLAGVLSEESALENPQMSKAWRWGHEAARAFSRLDNPDKSVIYRHFDDVLGSLQARSLRSENCKIKQESRAVERRYFAKLKKKGLSFDQIEKLKNESRKINKNEIELFKIAMADESADVRFAAATRMSNRLFDIAGPAPLDVIDILLNDSRALIRRRAVHQLAGRSDEKSLTLIDQALGDSDVEVRQGAAVALEKRQDFSSLALIARAFGDANRDVRQIAIRALHGRNEDKALDLLEFALGDSQNYIQQEAAKALADRNDPRSLAIIARSLSSGSQGLLRVALANALSGRTDSLDLIEWLINEAGLAPRKPAVLALANRSDSHSLKLLEQVLNEPSSDLHRTAVRALVGRTDVESLTLIEKIIDGPDLDLRPLGIFALANRHETRALDLLEKALKDSAPEIRRAAAQALALNADHRSKLLVRDFLLTNSLDGKRDYQLFRSCSQLLKLL